uniref:ATP synthase complex subunit 8 n=1 Tax=Taeniacara candidi TaxID=97002 RepID=A0A1L2BHN7_9CICH|nr:ATP synthase F0 subunit 8 [Taeniacara candidi]
MPQLDPAPWFAILVLSWVIFLLVLPPKILIHQLFNPIASQDLNLLTTGYWNWPWH